MKICVRCPNKDKKPLPLSEFMKNDKEVKWCQKCRGKTKNRYNNFYDGEMQKCARCPKKYNVNDETFRSNNGKFGKTCKPCREVKNEKDREYKKKMLEENPEEYRKHLAKQSNDLYHKNMKNEQYKEKRQEFSNNWRKENPEYCKNYSKEYRSRDYVIVQKYKENARKKGRTITLSDEEILELAYTPCFYCNKIDPRNYGGIDRIDSSDNEYGKEKCVACCAMCNYMKKSWEQSSFILLCGHVATFNGLEGGELVFDLLHDRKRAPYSSYQRKSKRKKIPFEITKREFYDIVKKECYICGKPDSKTHCNGIDRINPKLGYILNNCKSCCASCNYLKDRYQLNELLNKCSEIYLNCREKLNLAISTDGGELIRTKII